MRDRILDALLDELSETDREKIESFFETYTQRMLENSDLEKVKTAHKTVAKTSELHEDYDGKNTDLNSNNLQFLTPTSDLFEIPNLPDMDWGAPAPIIVACEHRLAIAYYLSNLADWDGETVRPRQPKLDEELMAVFYVSGLSSFSTRETLQPNHLCANLVYDTDEYPSHGVWEVQAGPSIAFKSNLLAYENDKHLIFSFHDSSIECFCTAYKFEVRKAVSIDLVPVMAEFVYS